MLRTEDEVNERLRRAFPRMTASFANVQSLPVEGMEAAIGDLTVVGFDGDGGSSSETWRAAYAEDAELRFPAFSLRPQSMLYKLLPGMLGLETVRLAHDDGFERAYYLCAVNPDRTRALFDSAVVAWFGQHPGLRLESGGRGLLLHREGHAPESFARSAAEIFRLLARAQRDAPPIAPQDPRAAAAAIPGFLGRRIREELFTRADLAAFLALPLPRKLPAQVQRYREKRTSQVLFGLGLCFAMVGAFFVHGFGQQGDWKGALFGAVFAAIGSPLAFFSGRARFRLKRLLRKGEVLSARVEQLESANWSTSDTGAVWKARLRYTVQGQSCETHATVFGYAIQRTQDALEGKQPVTIMCDPANPQRVLLADDLLTVSPEYER